MKTEIEIFKPSEKLPEHSDYKIIFKSKYSIHVGIFDKMECIFRHGAFSFDIEEVKYWFYAPEIKE